MLSDTMHSAPSLQWMDEDGVPHQRLLIDKIFLGRVCRGIDRDRRILISDPMVSRDHAMVRLTSDGVEITDMSKNGTWINNVRMTPGDSRCLENGDFITLGNISIRLYCEQLVTPEDQEALSEQTAVRSLSARVTCLVADVRGFSALSQKTDSAEVLTFIEKIFTRFSTLVNDHKGTVEGYFGDAIFAFWEHPKKNSPECALWACQAAISQLQSIPDIQRQLTAGGVTLPSLVLGWGVTTGPITLSHYGSRSSDLAVVGDSVNLAFRLSSMANKTLPAPIVMCSETASLVKDQMSLRDLGSKEIRGRSGVEPLFGLLSE